MRPPKIPRGALMGPPSRKDLEVAVAKVEDQISNLEMETRDIRLELRDINAKIGRQRKW